MDPVTLETSAQVKDFHFSQLKRREIMLQERKQKKIAWLKKMYQQGGAAAMEGFEGTSSKISSQLDDKEDTDDIEKEADQLLVWSEGLDFERYHHNWLTLSSSARSGGTHEQGVLTEDMFDLNDAELFPRPEIQQPTW